MTQALDAKSNVRPIPSKREIFAAFLKIGVSAFGGALPWARRVLVEEKKWLNDREFTEILTVCQAIPGPNVVNTAVFVGSQWRGFAGAITAFVGLIGAPFLLLIALSQLYFSFAYIPAVKSAMQGMSIVATAYLFYMSLKMAKPFYKNVVAVLLCLAAAILSGWFHWHMALVLLAGGAIGMVLSKKGVL
jgi:chromate transporter